MVVEMNAHQFSQIGSPPIGAAARGTSVTLVGEH